MELDMSAYYQLWQAAWYCIHIVNPFSRLSAWQNSVRVTKFTSRSLEQINLVSDSYTDFEWKISSQVNEITALQLQLKLWGLTVWVDGKNIMDHSVSTW